MTLLFLFGTSPAGAVTREAVTSCGQVISAAGLYYLPADLTCASSALNAGIPITASNVDLDLNGHKLIGVSGIGNGVITASNGSSVPGSCSGAQHFNLHNGTITGFSIGVYLCASASTNMADHVHNLNVTQNSVAMQTLHSNNNEIEKNNLSMNVSGDGLDLGGSGNNVHHNLIYGGTNANALFVAGDNNQIHDNVVAKSAYIGIGLVGNQNLVTDNVVSSSGSAGIFPSGNANSIKGNTAFNNSVDLGDANACATGIWKNNLFATATDPCIQ